MLLLATPTESISLLTAAALFAVAVLAGALNSVAGGGGFLVFPALLFTGVAPVVANATMTVSLWPASVAASGAYRREFTAANWRMMWPLFITSFIGALAGAQLLLHTPQETFMQLVPWLMLGATLLFAFSGRVTSWVRERVHRRRATAVSERVQPATHSSTASSTDIPDRRHSSSPQRARFAVIAGATLLQLFFSVYIGYFGAGAGILMLAMFAMMGMENIHTMNAFKMAMAVTANGVAITSFILAGTVAWPQALVMVCGAAGGGYLGAWGAQRMRQQQVRAFVIVLGAALTAYFFWEAFHGK